MNGCYGYEVREGVAVSISPVDGRTRARVFRRSVVIDEPHQGCPQIVRTHAGSETAAAAYYSGNPHPTLLERVQQRLSTQP